MAEQSHIRHLLRAGFERERSSDFAQLRRIPSTHVRKFLDYFSTLDGSEKDALADALVEGAFDCLFPDPKQQLLYRRNEAYRKCVDALSRLTGWKYEGVRGLRASLMLAKLEESELEAARPRGRPRMALAKPPPRPRFNMSADVKTWIESIEPVKSTEIRKHVKRAFSLIGSMAATHDDLQDWQYTGDLRGQAIRVAVDYSQRDHQLSYWVLIGNERPTFWGSSFERLMGLSNAAWDLLEQANLDQSVALLCDHVAYCADVLHQLPDYPSSFIEAPTKSAPET